MILHFPHMHPQFASGEPGPDVAFFDPGLDDQEGGESGHPRLRPDDLPLSGREVNGLVRQALEMGRGMKNLRQLAWFAAGTIEDFYADTSMAIRSELGDHIQGKTDTGENRLRATAQMRLAFTFFMERELLAADHDANRFDESAESFVRSLGFGEEDLEEARELGIVPQGRETLVQAYDAMQVSWRRVLESMIVLEPDAIYLTTEESVAEDLVDRGIALVELSEQERPAGVVGSFRKCRAPAWKILGRSRAPVDSALEPLLNRDVTILAGRHDQGGADS